MLSLANRSSELLPDFLSEVVLYAVSVVDLTLVVALGFVLARNVLKLVVERRRALPFARFRAKLVAVLLGMTLIPAVLVLLVGSELIRNSANRWFSPPIDEVLGSAREIASDYYAERQRAGLRPRRRPGPHRSRPLTSRRATWPPSGRFSINELATASAQSHRGLPHHGPRDAAGGARRGNRGAQPALGVRAGVRRWPSRTTDGAQNWSLERAQHRRTSCCAVRRRSARPGRAADRGRHRERVPDG